MKTTTYENNPEDWAPPTASAGIAFKQQLEGRWSEITEQHWDTLLFWLRGWLARNIPDKAIDAHALLADFALDCWLSIEITDRWTMPLTFNQLVAELKDYLAFTIRTLKKLS